LVMGALAGLTLLVIITCVALIVSGTLLTNATFLRAVVMILASIIGGMFGVNFKIKRKMPKI